MITRDDLLSARSPQDAETMVRSWVGDAIPARWREAAEADGPSVVRTVRTPDEYRAWYPTLAAAGLVVHVGRLHLGPDAALFDLGGVLDAARGEAQQQGGEHERFHRRIPKS